jgi:aminopeptidase N
VPACFELPLDLDVADGKGQVTRRTVRVTEKQQTFALPVAERPSFVVVDPEGRILGEVRRRLPADMLREELVKAPTARGKWIAAQSLAGLDDPVTVAALTSCLRDDKEFWGTRAECAAALGRSRTKECFESLRDALSVAHPKVRRAVVDALGNFRTPEAAESLKPYALRDESYLVESEAARALGRTRQVSVFDVLVDLLERPSWFDVVRAGAISGLAALRDDRAVPHLAARVRYGYPPRARRAAVLALPKLSTDRRTRETLEELLEDADPLLRIDVVRALGDLGDVKARGPLRERLDTDLDARVRRRIQEVVRDLVEPKRAAEQVRDDLEKLQTEHADLKARLAKLEARLSGAEGNGAKPKPDAKHGGTANAVSTRRSSKDRARREKRGKRR